MNDSKGNNPEDKHLINRVLHGDTRAFGIIIKNTENLVAQIVFKMVPTVEDRKDLAQDIYLKTFHNLEGFKFESKLSTWIARIAYNTCLSWIEKKKLILPGNLHDDENNDLPLKNVYQHSFQDSESILSQKELSGILRKEIDDLPVIYKTLITLFHHESMSYEELSQVTGLPEGTVKSSLFRARRMLKEKLLSKYQKEAL
ncbi:MAG TPA: sigma-70 family RNA polymerase sigma factor [Puia sp.]|nr:sigma-70 family RNA polymerase sigma factor [Puia sp.]